MLQKTSAYVKSYDGETKWMYYFIEDVELLKTYNGIWNRISNSIKKELDCKPIHNNKILKAKIRSYDKKVPKVGSNYNCLAVILLDSVLK